MCKGELELARGQDLVSSVLEGVESGKQLPAHRSRQGCVQLLLLVWLRVSRGHLLAVHAVDDDLGHGAGRWSEGAQEWAGCPW